ncbi:MAG: hypothetical protein BJBARM5_0612 [Candidatus Parvarchaeum acidophilus ARMAN-5]|jgi:hypothetical protein|uniref:Uncharacterized protein n=1 Tax=Candidatus Parvarchaeum acidophilus ARMAN-5 TaxID=662762 RepID=D6GVU3_PARA5|nr:MAG: hypothetical protein BJBARM5_0612 [Candidatus Parvarchaeum acidophilus ARMAN-5]
MAGYKNKFSSFIAESLLRKKEVRGALSFLCLNIAKKVIPAKNALTVPPKKSMTNITVYAILSIIVIKSDDIYILLTGRLLLS